MEKIKELIRNKKIQAAILIFLVCILFVAVIVSGRAGKDNSIGNSYKEATNTDSKVINDKEKEASEDAAANEKEAELETNADGKALSVVTENGETIDLTSDEIETETRVDGTVTYKMADGSEVILDQDGTAKVAKKSGESQTVSNEGTTVVSLGEANQSAGNSSSDSSEANTAEPGHSASQNAQGQSGAIQPSEEPTTQGNEVASTQPVPQTPEPPTQPPTECQHTSTTKKVTTQATATSNGAWSAICNNCGAILETGSIHYYSVYSVDLGGGQTATVYGYYDEEMADEIFRQLNTYRQENGLCALENRFHEESKIRALECAYLFSHARPNGQESWELNELMGGRKYYLYVGRNNDIYYRYSSLNDRNRVDEELEEFTWA